MLGIFQIAHFLKYYKRHYLLWVKFLIDNLSMSYVNYIRETISCMWPSLATPQTPNFSVTFSMRLWNNCGSTSTIARIISFICISSSSISNCGLLNLKFNFLRPNHYLLKQKLLDSHQEDDKFDVETCIAKINSDLMSGN